MEYLERAVVVICVTVVGLIAASMAGSVRAQVRSLQGTYINESQPREPIETAIEAAIAKMNFITRPIARNRLKKTNSPHRKLEITRTEQEISVAFDGSKPVRMPADGRTIKWTRDDGETFDVSGRWSDDQLVQSFKASDGERINTFNVTPDGTRLTLRVELRSPQLPAPVSYVLTFTASATP
jgi:heme/copper-type cytochrome/quinol oxidase subunit 2